MQIQTTREDITIAWLTALAITIHVAEGAFPSPLPGLKPGLANVVTIVVLIRFGWSSAAWVSLLRVLMGSLILGTFLSPTFVLSLTGALCSIAVLAPASRLPGTGFGPIGYSVLAALAHMGGQFLAAYWLFIPHPGLFHLLPVLMTAALIFGLLGGIITRTMLDGASPQPQ